MRPLRHAKGAPPSGARKVVRPDRQLVVIGLVWVRFAEGRHVAEWVVRLHVLFAAWAVRVDGVHDAVLVALVYRLLHREELSVSHTGLGALGFKSRSVTAGTGVWSGLNLTAEFSSVHLWLPSLPSTI